LVHARRVDPPRGGGVSEFVFHVDSIAETKRQR
jgi:hypothetical protein